MLTITLQNQYIVILGLNLSSKAPSKTALSWGFRTFLFLIKLTICKKQGLLYV